MESVTRRNHPLDRRYSSMMSRCFSKSCPAYPNYGGRGIKVCFGWHYKFWNFVHDMGLPPTPQHQIDRIDNDAHYSCGHCTQCIDNGWTANCRWATRMQQIHNRRRMLKTNTSGYRGVSKHMYKSGIQWKVLLRVDGVQRYFGCYTDPIEAAKVYDREAYNYLGNEASLNFPEDFGLTRTSR